MHEELVCIDSCILQGQKKYKNERRRRTKGVLDPRDLPYLFGMWRWHRKGICKKWG